VTNLLGSAQITFMQMTNKNCLAKSRLFYFCRKQIQFARDAQIAKNPSAHKTKVKKKRSYKKFIL
jgi:hypothetical protein